MIRTYLSKFDRPAPVHQHSRTGKAAAHAGADVATDGRLVPGAAVKRDTKIDTPHQNITGAVDHKRVEAIGGSSDPDRGGGSGAGAEDGAGVGAAEDERGCDSEVGEEFEDDGGAAVVFRAGENVRNRIDRESDLV